MTVSYYRASSYLQTIGMFFDQDLANFFPAEFLGVSDTIDGCAGQTVGQATVRR